MFRTDELRNVARQRNVNGSEIMSAVLKYV